MGSPDTETDRNENELQHEVTISRDYYLGAYEVTQSQYQKIMGENPSHFQGAKVAGDSSNHPVEQVLWEEAVEFCRRLSLLPEEKAARRVYRLPTEAEWEYACRAGTETTWSFRDNEELLVDYAWYAKNSDSKTHAVGQKKPNARGLYDMHGNVWEWCRDYYGSYDINQRLDPVGPTKGSFRVRRGGGWNFDAEFCRSAYRYGYGPPYRGSNLGFRLALSPAKSESAIQNASKDQ